MQVMSYVRLEALHKAYMNLIIACTGMSQLKHKIILCLINTSLYHKIMTDRKSNCAFSNEMMRFCQDINEI